MGNFHFPLQERHCSSAEKEGEVTRKGGGSEASETKGNWVSVETAKTTPFSRWDSSACIGRDGPSGEGEPSARGEGVGSATRRSTDTDSTDAAPLFLPFFFQTFRKKFFFVPFFFPTCDSAASPKNIHFQIDSPFLFPRLYFFSQFESAIDS